jgi:hypothetical protein
MPWLLHPKPKDMPHTLDFLRTKCAVTYRNGKHEDNYIEDQIVDFREKEYFSREGVSS